MLSYPRSENFENILKHRAGGRFSFEQIAHSSPCKQFLLPSPLGNRFLTVKNESNAEISCWQINYQNKQLERLAYWTSNGRGPHLNSRVTAVAVLNDRLVLTADDHSMLILWCINEDGSGTVLHSYEDQEDTHLQPIDALVVLSDTLFLAGSGDGRIKCFSYENSILMFKSSWDAHDRCGVTTLAVLPNGKILSGGDDYKVKCWSFDRRAMRLRDNNPVVWDAEFTDGDILIRHFHDNLFLISSGSDQCTEQELQENAVCYNFRLWKVLPDGHGVPIASLNNDLDENIGLIGVLPQVKGFLLKYYRPEQDVTQLLAYVSRGNALAPFTIKEFEGRAYFDDALMLPDGVILVSERGVLKCFNGIAPQLWLNQGCDAVGHRDYSRAAELWKLSASCGYPKGELNLGNLYAHGAGVDKNIQEAQALYQKAVIENDGLSENNLGVLFMTEATLLNYQQAHHYFQNSLDKGCFAAQCHLGLFEQYGLEGLEQRSLENALIRYRAAAHHGYPLAQLLCGVFCLSGNTFNMQGAHAQFEAARSPIQQYSICFYGSLIAFFERLAAQHEPMAGFILYAILKESFPVVPRSITTTIQTTMATTLGGGFLVGQNQNIFLAPPTPNLGNQEQPPIPVQKLHH